MMRKTYRHNGSEEDYAIYKEALNQATAEIRKKIQREAMNKN